jgi:DNA-binding transcriptional LysR family regulator
MADVEIRLFQYFVAVAEEQRFARAAVRLGISPSTLTHQIKKLESLLGARLVKRRGNTHTELTEAGRRLLDQARAVLQQVDEARIIVQQAVRGEVGRVEIGYQYLVACAGILQEAVAEFQRANPAIEIDLRHMVTMDQINAILHNELDIGFGRPPRRYPAGIQGFIVYRQPSILALPQNHPLARKKSIRPDELAGQTFVNPVIGSDLVFYRQTEALSSLGNFVPTVAKRTSDFFTVLTYVSAGYGIAAISKSMSKIALPNVVYREIDSATLPQTAIAVLHRRNEQAPAIRAFIKFMRSRALQ